MSQLRVWAPQAHTVSIEFEDRQQPLESMARGYYQLNDPALRDGVLYSLRLDGGDPLPDPRSGFQPHGVHGPSMFVEHDAFEWTDADFLPAELARAVVYELHVGTFTEEGTFLSLVERLDHLVELGVTHVELMPVNAFPGSRGWGYDGVLLFAPHAAYGTPADLKRLVDACHARGLGVILDVVYNHVGPDGNYLGRFGPYFTDAYHTPWGAAVNLDGPGSDEVRRFFCDNAIAWLRDYHFDGLRIDAVHAFIDRGAVHFLEQLVLEVRELERSLGKPKLLIAESDLNAPRLVRPRELGGYGLDAQWSDDFHHSLHALLTGERNGYYGDFGTLGHVAAALRQGYVYTGQYSAHRRRSHGRELRDVSLHQLLGYTQTHDQVGNRALGDRIGHALDLPRCKLLATLVLTAPFTPMLFQGEEWNTSSRFPYFTDHQDDHLARAVRDGRRREFAAFGWDPEQIPDPQAFTTFQHAKLKWHELADSSSRDLLEWYRALIHLRREEPPLTQSEAPSAADKERVRYDEEAGWLLVRRGALTIVCNFRAHLQQVSVHRGTRVVLASDVATNVGEDSVQLPPWGCVILKGNAR